MEVNMRPSLWNGIIILASLGATLSAATICAQDGPAPTGSVEARQRELGIRVRGGGLHQFDTDIDDGGGFDVTRLDAGLDAAIDLSDDLTLALDFGYMRDMYNFGGDSSTFGGGNPWGDINTGRIGARLNLHSDDQWEVWGGPIIGVSGEDGADLGDAITGGGTLGFTHHFNSDLALGAGIGVLSQIEDSNAVFPIIVVDWKIDEDLRLRTGGGVGASGGGSVELIWNFAPQWEFGVGGGIESRRFRLNDDGPFPNGVGEESSLPLFARLGYDISPNAELNLLAGWIASGELRLENQVGNLIREEDYESTPFVGVNFRLRF
jgi:hypothetical protein